MAILLDGTNGITTSGNNTLGDASTDTLNVGNGGLVKDASGNVGIGATPSAWSVWGSILQGNSYALTGYNNAGNVQSSWWMNSYRNSSGDAIYYSNGPASQLIQSGGTLYYNAASVGTTGSTITWSTPLTLAKDSTVALQGATSVAGTGITFPASQSASSNANTLDDYEEGNWTCTVIQTGGSGTVGGYTSNTGRYTKIGRLVNVSVYMSFTKGTLSGGQILFQGLPFVSRGGVYAGSAASYWNNLGASYVYLNVYTQDSTTNIELHGATAATSGTGVLGASAINASGNNEIIFNITYHTD